MRDPPSPRQSPAQLSSWNDGPAYYNVRADFAGRLRVPAWYVVDPLEAAGVIPGTAESASAVGAQATERKAQLPLCAGEDAPGRWVYTHSHYPDVRPLPDASQSLEKAFPRSCLQLLTGNVFGYSTDAVV